MFEFAWGSSLFGKKSCTIEIPMENRSRKVIWCGYTTQQLVAVNQGSCIGLGRDLIVSLSASLRQYTASTIFSNVVNKWWSISTGSSLAHRGFAYRCINLYLGSMFPKQYIHHIWEPIKLLDFDSTPPSSNSRERQLLCLHQIQEKETVTLPSSNSRERQLLRLHQIQEKDSYSAFIKFKRKRQSTYTNYDSIPRPTRSTGTKISTT